MLIYVIFFKWPRRHTLLIKKLACQFDNTKVSERSLVTLYLKPTSTSNNETKYFCVSCKVNNFIKIYASTQNKIVQISAINNAVFYFQVCCKFKCI
jgi:hypothetical protein